MRKPRVVIFDLGRVLVDFDFQKAVRDLKKYSPMTEKQIRHFFETTPLWDAYERGSLSTLEFFARLKQKLFLRSLTLEQFEPLWCNIFTEKRDTVDFLKKLRGKYRLAMLSNVNEMHWKHIRNQHDFMHWFDIPVASYIVGHRKPEEAIYKHLLEEAGATPEEALFTDDVQAHITAAESLGIRSHHFKTAKELEKAWKHLLE